MPTKKGHIKRVACKYPIFSFPDRDTQRDFLRYTQSAMRLFMQSMTYKSLDKLEAEERLRIETEQVPPK